MPEKELAAYRIASDGVWVTPSLANADAQGEIRFVIEGVMDFAHADERFDAVYTTGTDGLFTKRHDYLQWDGPAPQWEKSETEPHRYVFRVVPESVGGAARPPAVRVNVEKFVEKFLLPPSEVRAALSGELRVTVTQFVPPVNLWPMIGLAAVPTLAIAGGAGIIIRRRMALQGLSPELQYHVGSITEKAKRARAALPKSSAGTSALAARFDAVREGGGQLIRRIQELRNAQRLVDRPTLENEIARLERHMAQLDDAAAKREGEAALSEKRKALVLLDDLQRAENCAALRLTKIEAVLDTACLTLRSLPPQENSLPVEETLRQELDAEVAAIREVAQEIEAVETAQMQTLRS